ncbi:MAG: 30S ribosomal protein S24e [Candidatus Micrarchaeia archaeon]
MELKAIKDENNNIIKRREIELYVLQDDKTPSKDELKKEVCKKFNLNPETTVIINVNQQFGMKRSKVYVHSYQDKETLNKFEQSYILSRTNKDKKGKEEKPKEEEKKQ